MKRLIAVIIAAALILGAVAIRRTLTSGEPSADEPSAHSARVTRLLCAAELSKICSAISGPLEAEVTVEAPGQTVRRLAVGNALDADVWLTTHPWTEITSTTRPDAGSTTPIQRYSRLAVGGIAERVAALTSSCGSSLTWKCIASASGKAWGTAGLGGQPTWGTFELGVRRQDSTAGLLAACALANEWFRGPNYSAADLDDTDEFRTALARLGAESGHSDDPATQMISQPGSFSAVADLNLETTIADAAQRDRYSTVDDVATMSVQLAAYTPSESELTEASRSQLVQLATQAATDQGWRTGAPVALGTPRGAILERLATLWNEVAA